MDIFSQHQPFLALCLQQLAEARRNENPAFGIGFRLNIA
jgi:hypothetical protein